MRLGNLVAQINRITKLIALKLAYGLNSFSGCTCNCDNGHIRKGSKTNAVCVCVCVYPLRMLDNCKAAVDTTGP